MTRSEQRKEKLLKEQQTLMKLKENQKKLMSEKMNELKERVETGDFIQQSEDQEKTDLNKIEKYD